MRIDSSLQWMASSPTIPITSGVVVLLLAAAFVVSDIPGDQEVRNEYRRQATDDDEVHDEEIFQAVVQSLSQWHQEKKKKQAIVSSNSTLHHHRVKRDEEIVCYGELGCFRDEGPFDYLDMLPSAPEEVGTKFLLFTRQNTQTPHIFSYFNLTSMYGSSFNSTNPTKIIIHGFGSTCNRMWASEMRLALLSVEECNIICVDWENGAAMPNYVRAAVNTRLVGKQVALLVLWLNDHLGSRTQDYHLIGFSLGAHVAGFTGQELKNLSRITGLDPAGPLFESYDAKVRLDTGDALFVDVIHSNGDSLLMGGLGSWEPMGHVDFYPNGGRVQKGCSNLFLGAVRDFLWSASDGDGRSLCNHRRAYKFFTESVSPRCPFPAFACDSYEKYLAGNCFTWDVQHCGNMGYYADQVPHQKKGILYLVTREDEPFCANQFRVTVESSPSPAPVSTYGGLEAILIGHDFINETFLVTQTVKDNMVAGSVLQRIIVAHPAISEPIKVQLKYTAYNGWLYSGISRWSMDRLILTNAYGKSWSFCTRGMLLPSGIPLTVTLNPGVCHSGFPPGSNSLVGPNRPIYPTYPYEHHPSAIDTIGQFGIENNTLSPALTASESFPAPSTVNADLDTSMKPPAILNNLNAHDDVGPIYHIQPTELDWSAWHPLSANPVVIDPTISSSNLNENYSFDPATKFSMPIGTPVETYPAVFDMEDVTEPEQNIVTETEAVTLEPMLEDVQNQTETTPEVEETTIVVASNSTNSSESAESEPVRIRICRPSNGTENGTNNELEGRKLNCVEPLDEPSVHFEPSDHKSSELPTDGNELKALGADVPPDNPELRNEILNSIPVPPQSFWNAMQHNTTTNAIHPQYTGADPDVVLPPHLQYTLQQLDSQGFGPKSSHIAYRNTFYSHKNRGLIPSSRALKPRPVLLSSRRQAKAMNGGPVSPPSGPINIGPQLVGPIIANVPLDGRFSAQQQQMHLHAHHMAMLNHQSHQPQQVMNPHAHAPPADGQRAFPRRIAGPPPPVLNHPSVHSRSGQNPMIQLASTQQVVKSAPPPNPGALPGHVKNIAPPAPQSSYVTKHKGYYIVPYYFDRNSGANNGMLFPARRVFPHRRQIASSEPASVVSVSPQQSGPPPPPPPQPQQLSMMSQPHGISIVGNNNNNNNNYNHGNGAQVSSNANVKSHNQNISPNDGIPKVPTLSNNGPYYEDYRARNLGPPPPPPGAIPPAAGPNRISAR